MEREKLTDLNNTALPKLKDQLDKDLVSCHSYRCCLGCILLKMAAIITLIIIRLGCILLKMAAIITLINYVN